MADLQDLIPTTTRNSSPTPTNRGPSPTSHSGHLVRKRSKNRFAGLGKGTLPSDSAFSTDSDATTFNNTTVATRRGSSRSRSVSSRKRKTRVCVYAICEASIRTVCQKLNGVSENQQLIGSKCTKVVATAVTMPRMMLHHYPRLTHRRTLLAVAPHKEATNCISMLK